MKSFVLNNIPTEAVINCIRNGKYVESPLEETAKFFRNRNYEVINYPLGFYAPFLRLPKDSFIVIECGSHSYRFLTDAEISIFLLRMK